MTNKIEDLFDLEGLKELDGIPAAYASVDLSKDNKVSKQDIEKFLRDIDLPVNVFC